MQEVSSDEVVEDEGEEGPAARAPPMEDDSIQSFEGHSGERRRTTTATRCCCRRRRCRCAASLLRVCQQHQHQTFTKHTLTPDHHHHTTKHNKTKTDAVVAVAWSPAHADLVATGGQDDRAFLWRVGQDAYDATGGTLGTLELAGHSDTIVSLAFNSTGTLLATGSLDSTVKVWSAADGSLVQSLEGPADDVHWVAWHPTGDVVLAGSEDFSCWMWLARSGNCMQVFSGHRGPVAAGAFTADGRHVVTAGGEGDASLRVWNPKTGACALTVEGHPFHEDGITCLALHAAGGGGDGLGAAMTGGQDGSVRVTNLANGRVIASPQGERAGLLLLLFFAVLLAWCFATCAVCACVGALCACARACLLAQANASQASTRAHITLREKERARRP